MTSVQIAIGEQHKLYYLINTKILNNYLFSKCMLSNLITEWTGRCLSIHSKAGWRRRAKTETGHRAKLRNNRLQYEKPANFIHTTGQCNNNRTDFESDGC